MLCQFLNYFLLDSKRVDGLRYEVARTVASFEMYCVVETDYLSGLGLEVRVDSNLVLRQSLNYLLDSKCVGGLRFEVGRIVASFETYGVVETDNLSGLGLEVSCAYVLGIFVKLEGAIMSEMTVCV